MHRLRHVVLLGGGVSYGIYLNEPGTEEAIEFDEPHQVAGGTFAVGGTTEAWLNVTYNYGKHFDCKKLRGMTGKDSLPVLQGAADALSDDTDPDYWKPTEGNVKRALSGLISFAKARPDGVWDVS